VVTLLAPGFLAAAVVAALGVVAIHFIAWRRPDDLLLPTARFVPDESARRSARTVRPADLPLLLLRVAAVLLAGLGLARPVATPTRSGRALVVAVDRSRAVADWQEALDSTSALLAGVATRVVIAFDTTATPIDPAALAGMRLPEAPGSISTALLAAIREAARLRATHEEVTVALVSPLAEEEWDAATGAIRALWPDTIRVVRVRPRAPPPAATFELQASTGDPVRAGLELAQAHGLAHPGQVTRLIRREPDPSDTIWARATPGVLLVWPQAADGAASARDDRVTGDGTVRGVLAGDVAVVGHLVPLVLPDDGMVVGRWLDGTAAVREKSLGGGCIRRVGFDVPMAGDLTLTPAFQRVAGALAAPCGGPRRLALRADSAVRAFAAAPTASAGPIPGPLPTNPSRFGALLMALGTALLVAELFVRRRARGALAATDGRMGAA
jgi:hypothetical protein